MKKILIVVALVLLPSSAFAQSAVDDALKALDAAVQQLKEVVKPTPIPCIFTVSPTTAIVPFGGGAANFTVSTTDVCVWTALSLDSWAVPSTTAGTGLGQVTVTVASNQATTARTTTVVIAGQKVNVSQGAAPIPDTGVVTTAADLTKALAAKQSTIKMKGILTGNFTAIAPVTLTCATPPLVGPGIRVKPADVAACQLIAADKLQSVVTIASSDVTIWGITMTGVAPDRIVVAIGSEKETDASKLPRRVTINQCAILGDSAGLGHRGVQMDGGDIKITNNHIAGFLERYRQSQGLLSSNGPGPFLIENNKVEASGENIMFGGSDPAVPNLVPSDITVRNNDLSKPLDQYLPNSVVNNFELKNARRVLLEGNLLDGSRVDVQVGNALTLTPRNQDGRCPWCTVEDVVVRKNVFRNYAGRAVQILCNDNHFTSGRAKNFRFENNLMEGPNVITLTDGMDGDLIIVNNSWPKVTGAVLTFNGPLPPAGIGAACRPNLVMTGNVGRGGRYSINAQFGGGQGYPSITSYTSTDVKDVTKVGGNVIEESDGTTAIWGRWPGGNKLLGLGALAPLLDDAFHYKPDPTVGW